MAAEQPICIQSVALGALGIHFSVPHSNHHLGHNINTSPANINVNIIINFNN